MISLSVAKTKDDIIGKDGTLPWRIKEELAYFKKNTDGKFVVMGGTTFQSLPKLLPNRHHIVLSRGLKKEDYKDNEWVDIVSDVETLINKVVELSKNMEVVVIGGASIYDLFLKKNLVEKMYISEIKEKYEGDTKFPLYDEEIWKLYSEEEHDEFIAKIYVKNNTIKILNIKEK